MLVAGLRKSDMPVLVNFFVAFIPANLKKKKKCFYLSPIVPYGLSLSI